MATFLTAQWKKLAIVNYTVDPELLYPFLPAKTEIDIYDGKCFLSLVGFLFQNTKVLGIKVPYHINFEEVNLRFYVKHTLPDGEEKRGVVFIKEVVPKKTITWMANKMFHEKYETMLMKHELSNGQSGLHVAYFWGRSGGIPFGFMPIHLHRISMMEVWNNLLPNIFGAIPRWIILKPWNMKFYIPVGKFIRLKNVM